MAADLRKAVRAGEWWDDKLVPLLTAFYATLVVLGRPIAAHWADALALLGALLAGAAFVSLVNDFADLDDDRAAGKTNRMAGRSRAWRAAAVLLPIAAGLAFLWLWRDSLALAAAYLAAWLAFALYSLPPVRLKARGLAGVLADASGAHLFPTLAAILLAFRAAGAAPDPVWLAGGAAWALGYGLRGILWHQLLDRDSDRASGTRTFVQRHRPQLAERIGAFAAFPLELAGLAVLLAVIGTPWPLLLLAFYLAVTALRTAMWRMNATIVRPAPRYFILMHEYYCVYFPLAVLVAAAIRHPADLAVLAVHLLLFHTRAIESARTLAYLAASLLRRRHYSR